MKTEPNIEWTVGHLIDLERGEFLRVNSEYQRGLRWSDMQKQMFIDSIFRGYSIPAFYLHKIAIEVGGMCNTYYDIVDGQQRIDAICKFSKGAFPLLDTSDESKFRFPNFVKDEECPWGGKRFKDLSGDLQDKLKNHSVVVYEIETKEENRIRDLFIRLQGGTPLSPQDKRDSWPGNFTKFVLDVGGKKGLDECPGHAFFKDIAKIQKEDSRRQIVAQSFMLFWNLRKEKKFCDIQSPNIDEFYHSQVDFKEESEEGRRFKKICDVLHMAMHGKPRIDGHYIIHLILIVDSLMEEYVRGWEQHLANKLFEFRKAVSETSKAMQQHREVENMDYYTEYGALARTGASAASTIRRRHAFFCQGDAKIAVSAQERCDKSL